MKAGDYDSRDRHLNRSHADRCDARCNLGASSPMPIAVRRPKQTDPAEKSKRLQEAVADYQKAIDLKQKAMETTKGSRR